VTTREDYASRPRRIPLIEQAAVAISRPKIASRAKVFEPHQTRLFIDENCTERVHLIGGDHGAKKVGNFPAAVEGRAMKQDARRRRRTKFAYSGGPWSCGWCLAFQSGSEPKHRIRF